MVFSRRERVIIVVATVVLASLVLDRFALTPLLDSYAAIQVKKEKLQSELIHAGSVLDRSRIQGRRWRTMLAGGMAGDPAAAESRLLHAVRAWSRDTGLSLVALKPHRSREKTELPIIEFRATAAGSWRSVYRFIQKAAAARMPIRIKTVRVTSRKSGTDDLNIHMNISTLYAPGSGPAAAEKGNAAASPEKKPASGPAEAKPASAPAETKPASAAAETKPAIAPAKGEKR